VTYHGGAGGIATITLRRERALNAINQTMMRAIWTALDEFHDDRTARVAILRGAGRAFCAGGDNRQPITPRVDPAEDISRMAEAFLGRDRGKPIIASVHGHVIGAGLRMALLADFIVCGESTLFRAPEVQHGLNSGFFWTHLQARTGEAFAMDVVATGREWTGQEAADRGLVTRCVPDDQLLTTTLDYATRIADQPAAAMEALVATRRTAVRMLDLKAWTSRRPDLATRPGPLGSAEPPSQ